MKSSLRYPLIFLFIFWYAATAKAQFVTIPDSSFRAWLNSNGYASCMSGNDLDTTCPAVVNATKVSCPFQGISDLTGIEYFDNLDTLVCYSNSLTNLPALNSSLVRFECDGNAITTLPSLPISLIYFTCSGNLLTTLPALPTTIKYLQCAGNLLTSLPTLPDSLYYFTCNQNNLSSLPVLPAKLHTLYCYSNPLYTLPSLPASLNDIVCSSDSLTTLPPLPAGLNRLECDYNNLASLPPLPNSLNYLRCNWNSMISIGTLPNSLISLSVSNCGLSTLPVLPSSLRYLYCQNNQLTSLPSLPNGLEELYCDNNQITSLPPYPLSLYWLNCEDNLITTLPSPLPPLLNTLNCSRNLITSLPTFNSNILNLRCISNLLTSLPPLPADLWNMNCDSNQIASLPTLPPDIWLLSCANNPITVLPELPDTMGGLNIDNCPINCLPEIQKLTSFNWAGTGLTCIANYIDVQIAVPSMTLLPLCQPSGNCIPYWNISGNVFKDLNSNCINELEPAMKNIPVRLDSAGITLQVFLTRNDGSYAFHTFYGTYEVKIDTTELPFNVTCPASFSYTSVITPVDPYDSLVDFALECKPGFDLIASGVGISSMPRPNATRTFYLSAGDAAIHHGSVCAPVLIGSVRAVFSGPVDYTAPAPGALTPSIVNGDTLTWNVSDFTVSDPFVDFNVIGSIHATATASDTICVELTVNPSLGDNYPQNNSNTVCFALLNSFDPNAKSMSPFGAVDTSQQWFTFTLFFQNTGNAPAEDIYLLDTLSNYLDPSTFVFQSSSHDVITQMLPGNVLRFNFPDINLIDSTTNEPNSHGYVQFRVKRQQGLAVGTTISNTAYIYFDYNPPVITNTTSATLTLPVSIAEHSNVSIRIYPNPVEDLLYIDAGKTNFQQLEILDLPGRLIYSKDFSTHTKSTSIDISFLQAGVYMLKLNSGSGLYVEKFVVK